MAVAFLIAATTLSISPQTTQAYWTLADDYRWGDQYIGGANTQNHLIYVCMTNSFKTATGGNTWTWANKWHARAMEAMNAWNNLNQEMAYKVTDTTCESLNHLGLKHLRLGFTSTSVNYIAQTANGTKMQYPCSAYCQWEATITFNGINWEWWGENYVWMNGQYQIYGLRVDFKTIIMHELGHAAGLGHSTDNPSGGHCEALMARWDLKCWSYPEFANHGWLSLDDMIGFDSIYADDAGPG